MQFCPRCSRTMRRVAAGARLSFVCACGFEQEAADADRCIAVGGASSSEVDANAVRMLLRTLALDQTVARQMCECPNCSNNVVAVGCFTPEAVVVRVCTNCGTLVSNDAADAAAAADAADAADAAGHASGRHDHSHASGRHDHGRGKPAR